MTVVGCLTGNGDAGRRLQVAGAYSFLRRGTREPFPPDLPGANGGGGEQVDGGRSAVPFARGALTDGDPTTAVGWRGRSVGEIGPDILIELGQRLFVDRVVLRQAHPPARQTSVAATRADERATDAAGDAPSPGGAPADPAL